MRRYAENRLKGRYEYKKMRSMLAAICLVLVPVVPSWAQSRLKTPELTKRSRKGWLRVLQVPADCASAVREPRDPKQGTLKFHRLGDKEYVVEVSCGWMAYQTSEVFAYYNESNRQSPVSRLLKLKTYEAQTTGRVTHSYQFELSGFSEFNAKRKELEIYNKSTGAGCGGSLVTYGFRNGRAYVKRARADPCSPNSPINPYHWKRVKRL
jgi:hypothetical protein